jgi:hypothetical protein
LALTGSTLGDLSLDLALSVFVVDVVPLAGLDLFEVPAPLPGLDVFEVSVVGANLDGVCGTDFFFLLAAVPMLK